jgi:acyl carrier protein
MPTAFINRSDVEPRLRAIIARIAKVDPGNIGVDDDLAVTLGIDSLSALRIAAAVETEFEITIPDDRLHEIRSLGQLAALVVGRAS